MGEFSEPENLKDTTGHDCLSRPIPELAAASPIGLEEITQCFRLSVNLPSSDWLSMIFWKGFPYFLKGMRKIQDNHTIDGLRPTLYGSKKVFYEDGRSEDASYRVSNFSRSLTSILRVIVRRLR
jgi:hypothetical protein